MAAGAVAKAASVRAVVGTVEIDASVSEEHSATAEITRHPVEKGARITDHIRPESKSLTIEGVIANTPLSEEQIRKYGEAPRGAPGRAEKAQQELLRMLDTGAVFTVVTKLRTYSNMAIKSLRFPRDGKTGDALRVSIQLEQIREVASETVQLRVVIPSGKAKVDTGAQVAKPATEAERRRSQLHKFFFK